MKSNHEEPLLEHSSPTPADAAALWGCGVSLFATMVGVGILSLPISLAYAGFLCGTGTLLLFAWASEVSLNALLKAAALTSATSFVHLGELVWGSRGRALVMASLFALLLAAAVIVHICITDLLVLLLHVASQAGVVPQISRTAAGIGATVVVAPLCTAHDLQQLRVASSASVGAVLLACLCVIAQLPMRGAAPASELVLLHVSPRLLLALPIQSLAYCCQFSVIELAHGLRPAARTAMPRVVRRTMAAAGAVYATFGMVGYVLLGDTAALAAPNILTAFGTQPLIVVASAAVLLTNLIKFPLVLLPLRATLLELCALPPRLRSNGAHAALTLGLVGAVAATALAFDLAVAFEVAGASAGTLVAYVLPGLLLHTVLRRKRTGGADGSGVPPLPPSAVRETDRDTNREGTACEEMGLLAMVGVGGACGVVSLVAIAMRLA